MKKLVLIAVAVISFNASFASKNPGLATEVLNNITVDLSNIKLDVNQPDFVSVSFMIVDSTISITGIDGSKPELKRIIELNLNQLKITADHDENQTYIYKIIFKTK